MHRSTIRHICLVLATILMAASLPMPADCTMTAHPDAAPCAGAPAADHADDGDSSHCDAGCSDCGLPCCVGTAVILAAVPALAPVAPVLTPLPPDGPARPQAEPGTLGRPPRA